MAEPVDGGRSGDLGGLGELEEVERVFAALAHASRRHILLVIRFRGGEMTAGSIASRFQCSWPTTTRHLRVLRDAGLLSVEKRGRERVYRLESDRLHAVAGRWLGWFDSAPDSPKSAQNL